MLKKIKTIFKLVVLLYKNHNDDSIKNVIELLKDSKRFIVLSMNDKDAIPSEDNITYYTSETDNTNIEFLNQAKNVIKRKLFEKVGPQNYEMNLEHYDYDLAMGYKEADYQITRADALEAELEYYKEVNSINGKKGPQLLQMWNKVQDTKKRLEMFN